ncbi:MAG: TetR/AcrR family transcriptional regulator [Nocardioidaceae bacterium]
MAGLRELKKQRTRETIQHEALRLIAEQGYETTTCEQIAAAAEVSPATLFRYFATKEDIVLHDVYDPLIAQAVLARPAQESPLTAVRRGLADAMSDIIETDLEAVRQRTALILSIPALRSRSREQHESLTSHLAQALAQRAATSGTDLHVEVAAGVCAAALTVAVERWARLGGDLRSHVDEALAAVGTLTRGARR